MSRICAGPDDSISPDLPPVETKGQPSRKTAHLAVATSEDTVKIRVWVETSRIIGQGLLAAQDIPKGTRIIQYIGEKIPKDASRRLAKSDAYIFTCNECYDIDGKTLKNRVVSAIYLNTTGSTGHAPEMPAQKYPVEFLSVLAPLSSSPWIKRLQQRLSDKIDQHDHHDQHRKSSE